MNIVPFNGLSNAKKEIRILELSAQLPLDGHLVRASLHNIHINYVALSYTWGDPITYSATNRYHKNQSVCINGMQLSVAGNLAAALHYLRKRKVSNIWVDALCIDQGNIQERGDQVKMMGDVYRKATRVLVWLGPATSDSDLAMRFLALLARCDTMANPKRAFLAYAEMRYYDSWMALKHLLKRTWWKRAWVIQEVALAKEVEFACGDETISESEFTNVEQLITKYWAFVFPTDLNKRVGLTGRMLDPFLFLSRMRIFMQTGKKLEVLPLLWLTKQTLASDSRDILFAKYGLLGDKATTLCSPAYTAPFDGICRRFLEAYIEKEKDLSIICNAGLSFNGRTSKLPSWLPDWGTSNPAYPLQCSWDGGWPVYRASGNMVPDVRFSEDGSALYAKGIMIDTIDGIQFDPWCRESFECGKGRQSQSETCAYGDGEELFEALYRTVVADTYRQEAPFVPEKAPREFGYLFARKCRECDEDLAVLNEPQGYMPTKARSNASNIEKRWHGMRNLRLGKTFLAEVVGKALLEFPGSESETMGVHDEPIANHHLWASFEHSIGQAMMHRRIFTTRNGYLGLGTRTLMTGDKICVMLGCATPLIVRASSNKDHYILLGETYIHGIMSGEAIERYQVGIEVESWIGLC
ncbi:hypothetical protein COCCADRAFT_22172 [Bipolaris zeicola 26-R-13]|uniref:Heterokaryon incompatibility domain-containing protein n=1 Tax=Cochliobolus carbonum (strain 26-R-13) TaxID=930089 RepID=W6YSA8_COCC2|nr:uncharacterized protein COCCADRAFT_22172 [Bipolaris zeicola 26-R-13]EUC38294.1 hypothetical protein COCCADRAFT_22172 [Bipolaris zeicola 26-R-13]